MLLAFVATAAWAKPPAPAAFCAKYPTSQACNGTQPACTYCHVAAPQRNAYGTALEQQMAPGAPRPLSDADFTMALTGALAAVEASDSDGDNVSNLVEITRGTLPADPASFPRDVPCAGGPNPQYKVCNYDLKYVYRKLLLDFCGFSPTYGMVKTFEGLATDELKRTYLDSELDRCLGTDFWRGKNGVLWKLAHPKIRPVGSLKAGEDQGQIPLADYYDDYALFTYAHIDDHDVRSVLTADFFVARSGANPTVYTPVTLKSTQAVEQSRRAGNMTTAWTLTYFVMFTALPRNAASQMYRAYLGLDIAKQEGLYSVAQEPRDYDAKGVQAAACAACHATLDPLSYPFRNYNGLTGPRNQNGRYVPNRLETLFAGEGPTLAMTPERGVIFNQPVDTLTQWGQVAANSDEFLRATVTDYWKLLVGHAPTAEENAEFVTLWRDLKATHNYRVKPMLHQLIRTEAYGAP
jgi:cytochrome c553